LRHLPHIDGLRAVAVLPVVFYHAGFPGFPGGFVGVDVFFVISGYLITRLIADDLAEGRFSIVGFYERRARRILPALFVLVLATSIAAAFLLLPREYETFSRSALAAIFFSANIFFRGNGGYFEESAVEQPLLHTWSLGVEEQFYILFPLILMGLQRWLRSRWLIWLAPVFLGSFAGSVWASYNDPDGAFYLTLFRAWELMMGAALALGRLPPLRSRLLAETVPLVGLALIGWGVVGLSNQSLFPGANALFPCVGAFLVLYSGVAGTSLGARLLSTSPFTFVGKISYSLYLWHWPVLVFGQFFKAAEMTYLDRFVLVGLSFAAAVLSWRYVETPFRGRNGILTRRQLFAAAGAAAVLLAAMAGYGIVSDGWRSRVSDEVLALAAASAPGELRCIATNGRRFPLEESCLYGEGADDGYVLWGDSHAFALAEGLGEEAARHGASFRYLGGAGCPPILGTLTDGPNYLFCGPRTEAVYERIVADESIETVILLGHWAAYIYGGTTFGPAENGIVQGGLLNDPERTMHGVADREGLFARQFRATVEGLLAAGKRVVIVYPVPETGFNIPPTLARLAMMGRSPDEFVLPVRHYVDRHRTIEGILDSLPSGPEVVRIRPAEQMCDAERCTVLADGEPLYWDDDHLSLAGARFIAPLFEPVFDRD
jgi:peptidoglycan/LPS O-acetylase OafA/YrhL